MPKYTSVNNIPAKTFFDIMESKDFNLLEPFDGETYEQLSEVFTVIYDDYFVRTDNQTSKSYLDNKQTIAFLNYKIQSIVQVLDFLFFNKTTPEIRKTLLEALISIGVNINLEVEFVNEIKNILQVEVGLIQNEINLLEIDMENIAKENKNSVFNFYEHLIGLESVHERSLDDAMVLAKYIEYQKLAEKKISMQAKINQKK